MNRQVIRHFLSLIPILRIYGTNNGRKPFTGLISLVPLFVPMRITVLLSMLFSSMFFLWTVPPAFSWDGRWTQARSGGYHPKRPIRHYEDDLEITDDKTGAPWVRRRWRYFKPRRPYYEELSKIEHAQLPKPQDYSPKAIVTLPFVLKVFGKTLQPGRYTLQVGGKNLTSIAAPAPPQAGTSVMVLSRLGRVFAVLPVHQHRIIQPSKKQKKAASSKQNKGPSNPTATIVYESQGSVAQASKRPIIRYQIKNQVYETRL